MFVLKVLFVCLGLTASAILSCEAQKENDYYRRVVVKDAPGKGIDGQCEPFAQFVARKMSKRTTSYEVGYAWWNHKPPFGPAHPERRSGLHKVVVWTTPAKKGFDLWIVDNIAFREPMKIDTLRQDYLSEPRFKRRLRKVFDRYCELIIYLRRYGR